MRLTRLAVPLAFAAFLAACLFAGHARATPPHEDHAVVFVLPPPVDPCTTSEGMFQPRCVQRFQLTVLLDWSKELTTVEGLDIESLPTSNLPPLTALGQLNEYIAKVERVIAMLASGDLQSDKIDARGDPKLTAMLANVRTKLRRRSLTVLDRIEKAVRAIREKAEPSRPLKTEHGIRHI